ncbi:MAG: methyltransferase domain-containing protein, partial [Bdellovibrionota bacterium]
MIQRLRRFKTWLKPQVMRFLRLTQLYRLRSPAPAPTRPMWPVWQVEKPDVTKDFDGGSTFHISGWIAYPGKLEKLRIADSSLNAKMPVRTARRPEFRSKYGFPGVQFSAECPLSDVHGKPFLTLAYEADRRPFEIIVPVHTGKVDLQERKATKLARIEKILACPSCRTGLQRAGTSFSCAQCQANYPVKEEHIDFLTEEFKREFNIVPTSNVSANGYDGTAMNEIYRLHDKLILDCGAGFHSEYFENVVNYEIVAYDSTDVLGVGERLPFSDHSFDAVFSFAVLEHVKDPFLCARELMRVLKPGGYFYCEVPFLQPVHGYPHHYYNMT